MEGDDYQDGGERNVCQPAAATIKTLPEEMLIHILSYLSPKERCNTIPKVCTQWEAIHPRLYRELTFRQGEDVETVDKCMKFATSLKYFTLIVNDIPDVITILRRQSVDQGIGEKLRSFTLILTGKDRVHNKHERDTLDCFERTVLGLLKKCLKLEILHLELLLFHSNGFYRNLFSPINTMDSLRGLRTVRIMRTSNLLNDRVGYIGHTSWKLEELSVYSECLQGWPMLLTTYTGKELTAMCNRRSDILRLLHLNYGSWSVGDLSSLKLCRFLQDLSFCNAGELSDEGLLVIASLDSLRKLKLTLCTAITEVGWIRMITSPEMKQLESLVLDQCDTKNKIALAIGANLNNLKVLSVRSFRSVFNPELCAPCIFLSGFNSIIEGCPKLIELCLCRVDPVIRTDSHLIPTYLPRLRKLTISPGQLVNAFVELM